MHVRVEKRTFSFFIWCEAGSAGERESHRLSTIRGLAFLSFFSINTLHISSLLSVILIKRVEKSACLAWRGTPLYLLLASRRGQSGWQCWREGSSLMQHWRWWRREGDGTYVKSLGFANSFCLSFGFWVR